MLLVSYKATQSLDFLMCKIRTVLGATLLDIWRLNPIMSEKFLGQCMVQSGSLIAQLVKNLPAIRETWIWSLVWEDPLEKGMATHSSILAWRLSWTEEPGGSCCSPWGCKESEMIEWLTHTRWMKINLIKLISWSYLLLSYVPLPTTEGFASWEFYSSLSQFLSYWKKK